MVCAVTNNAVDKAANSIWEAFPKQERHKYKFLRYETNSAEMQAYRTRKDTLNPVVGEDPNARPTYKAASTIDDDDLIRRRMAEYATLQGEHSTRLLSLYTQLRNFREALEQKQRLDARKESNVPAAMTLLDRMFELSVEDECNADLDLQAELEAYRVDKLEPAAVEERRLKGQYRTGAAALGEDKLDEKEITARLNDGRIPSLNQRNPSFEYRRLLNGHAAKDGDVPRQALHKFEDERIKVVMRVLRATHVLFSTCNNAGSEVVKLGCSPSIISIDESGQLTVAALASVLTSFDRLRATNLFGDIPQLLPYLPDVIANEFRENGLLSVLALLDEKGYPIFRLSLQYRMAPAIMQWPSKFFCKGLLKNHAKALVDNANRKVARDIAMKEYGITGPNGNGSEYWMIDVVNGVSHMQLNGTSLQNHANADRIATLVDQTLSRGVDPSKITALSY